ncbi:uncharacterized protein LOC123290439 [Chrysoperla carnea]|uniref:uncharacterized protein LOC123290439 n=1 Tax=Chrysoperla carnea TaxID=189513 RepID=UPI001D063A95|nr:uncharacterized protein LOC123290439 [Chrysoperla carnea]
MKHHIWLLISLHLLVTQKISDVNSIIAKVKNVEQDESRMGLADLTGIKMTKYNKTMIVLSGKYKIFKKFENLKINAQTFKKMGNGFIAMSMFTLKNQDYCGFLNDPKWQKIFFDKLFNHTDLPYNCNSLPGEYTISEYVPAIPENVPSGDYRMDLEYVMNDKIETKYRLFVAVI